MSIREALSLHGHQLSVEEAEKFLEDLAHGTGRVAILQDGHLLVYFELSSWWKQCEELVRGKQQPSTEAFLLPLTESILSTLRGMQEGHMLAALEFYQAPLDLVRAQLLSDEQDLKADLAMVEGAENRLRNRFML